MLGSQTRIFASCPDMVNPNRLAQDSRQCQRRAQNLAASFTVTAVNNKHFASFYASTFPEVVLS
jgi:hypothetical protein